jgi:t-SNARE complex subunit (syntaxin)
MGSMDATDEAKRYAAKARRMKQIGFGVVVVILITVALILGLYFGIPKTAASAGSN